MTDASAPAPVDPLEELLAAVLEQAEEIAGLDAARAEAWASDVLAHAEEWGVADGDLIAALRADDDARAATTLAALAGLVDVAPVPRPPRWAAAVGTARCVGAWSLRVGADETAAFRFVDADDDHHVLTVDFVAGSPETIGDVVVGPGDLLTALDEEDARVERHELDPAGLARRVLEALAATGRPTGSAVANGRLVIRRLRGLAGIEPPPPAAVDDHADVPAPPERDPLDDAHALDVLARALGPSGSSPSAAVDAVAGLIAPADLAPLTVAQRDAVFILEWADWLGAVIGLVRAGPGAAVDGGALVDHVNRCPEVTTTIPKADRARIAWAFDTMTGPWEALGVVDRGRLTAEGAAVLPAALRRAWGSDDQA